MGLVALAVTLHVSRELWAVPMIVRAPNAGAEPGGASAHGPIDGATLLRVPVGPPAAELSVAVLEPETEPARATVLLLHGIRDDKRAMLGTARLFREHGLRAVAVDLRGHGTSTGHHLTYGVRESVDLVQLLDALEREGLRKNEPVGAYGVSYGAATAIQLAARDRRVRAVVAVAPFESLRVVVPHYMHLYLPSLASLAPEDWIHSMIDAAGREAGFDPDQASTLDAVTRTEAPILFVHGTEDARIPIEGSERMTRLAPSPSRLVRVEGADHLSVTGKEHHAQVARESLAWLERHLLDP